MKLSKNNKNRKNSPVDYCEPLAILLAMDIFLCEKNQQSHFSGEV